MPSKAAAPQVPSPPTATAPHTRACWHVAAHVSAHRTARGYYLKIVVTSRGGLRAGRMTTRQLWVAAGQQFDVVDTT